MSFTRNLSLNTEKDTYNEGEEELKINKMSAIIYKQYVVTEDDNDNKHLFEMSKYILMFVKR